MTPTLESIAERDMKQAIAYADPLNPLLERIFAPASADDKRVKAAKKCLNAAADRREDGMNDARDILAEQKRTRGDED